MQKNKKFSDEKEYKTPPKPDIKNKNKGGVKWVAVYTRVSSKSESQKTSIENQPKYFERLFSRPDIKKKYKQVYIYPEYGKTGTKLIRPKFEEMLQDCGLRIDKIEYEDIKDHKNPRFMKKQIKLTFSVKGDSLYDELWVKSTSRFARNIKAVDVLDALKDNGVYVKFIDYNLSTEHPQEYKQILDLLNNDMYFSMALSNTMKAAKELVKEEGILNSNGKLFGYDYFKRTNDSNPFFKINESEAVIVRKIFELYAYGEGKPIIKYDENGNGIDKGYGVRRIANYLKEHQMFNRQGNPFGPTTIKNMLSNEKYMGQLNAGKFTTGSVFNKYTSNYITEDYIEYLKETPDVPAIISKNLWEICDKKRAKRVTNNSDKIKGDKNIKTGKNFSQNTYAKYLKCGLCNGTFRYDNNSGNPFYTCSTKEREGVSACSVNNVYLKQINEYVSILKNGEYNELFRLDVEEKLISIISIIEKNLIDLGKNTNTEEIKNVQEIIDKQNVFLSTILTSNTNIDTFKKLVEESKTILQNATEKLEVLTSTPDLIITKIKEMLDSCYNIIDVYKDLKEIYTEEEILNKLDRIEVYGVRLSKEKIIKEIYNLNLDEYEKTEKVEIIKKFGNIPIPKPILFPVFKESTTLNKLINFNTPTFTYKIKELVGEDELLDEPFLSTEDLNYNTFKVTLDNNLSGDAYNLETGYIKNLGIVDSPSVLEQIIIKLDSLRVDAEEIINKYANDKTEI